ncbi:hypothetical protein MCERE19_03216 [Spirosomataceae bacterium]
MTEIVLSILSWVVLFLFALNSLSDTIQNAVAENAPKSRNLKLRP